MKGKVTEVFLLDKEGDEFIVGYVPFFIDTELDYLMWLRQNNSDKYTYLQEVRRLFRLDSIPLTFIFKHTDHTDHAVLRSFK